jgi:hypothetical protein
LDLSGSPGRTRTADKVVNSQNKQGLTRSNYSIIYNNTKYLDRFLCFPEIPPNSRYFPKTQHQSTANLLQWKLSRGVVISGFFTSIATGFVKIWSQWASFD